METKNKNKPRDRAERFEVPLFERKDFSVTLFLQKN
jgi:hypothetical protein